MRVRRHGACSALVILIAVASAAANAAPVSGEIRSALAWQLALEREGFSPGLIDGNPDLNEIILFDRRRLGQAWHSPKAFRELLSLRRKLRESRFDLVIDRVRSLRVLTLATFRPEFVPRWAGDTHVTLLTVSRLRMVKENSGKGRALGRLNLTDKDGGNAAAVVGYQST